MIMTMNRQMSTPHLFFDNSNPGHNYSTRVAEQPTNTSIWTPQNGSLGSTILILDSTFWLDSTLRIRPGIDGSEADCGFKSVDSITTQKRLVDVTDH
jgi:hypothetical protein